MDILNKLDPMPCGFGPAIKPAAKPTVAELREKELREFETKTDKPVWFGADFGDVDAAMIELLQFHAEMRQRWINDSCGVSPLMRATVDLTAKEVRQRVFVKVRPFLSGNWLV